MFVFQYLFMYWQYKRPKKCRLSGIKTNTFEIKSKFQLLWHRLALLYETLSYRHFSSFVCPVAVLVYLSWIFEWLCKSKTNLNRQRNPVLPGTTECLFVYKFQIINEVLENCLWDFHKRSGSTNRAVQWTKSCHF